MIAGDDSMPRCSSCWRKNLVASQTSSAASALAQGRHLRSHAPAEQADGSGISVRNVSSHDLGVMGSTPPPAGGGERS